MAIDNDPTGRRSRVFELDPSDWVMVHKNGSRHQNADALSRQPASDPTELGASLTGMHTVASVREPDCSLSPNVADQAPAYSLSNSDSELWTLQHEDSGISTVLACLERGAARPPHRLLRGSTAGLRKQ